MALFYSIILFLFTLFSKAFKSLDSLFYTCRSIAACASSSNPHVSCKSLLYQCAFLSLCFVFSVKYYPPRRGCNSLPLPSHRPCCHSPHHVSAITATQPCTYSAFKRSSVSGLCINEGPEAVYPRSCISLLLLCITDAGLSFLSNYVYTAASMN
jgi:hypothetical protein